MQTAALTLMPIGLIAMGIGKVTGPGTNDHAIVAAGRMLTWFGAATFLTGLGLGLAAAATA